MDRTDNLAISHLFYLVLWAHLPNLLLKCLLIKMKGTCGAEKRIDLMSV